MNGLINKFKNYDFGTLGKNVFGGLAGLSKGVHRLTNMAIHKIPGLSDNVLNGLHEIKNVSKALSGSFGDWSRGEYHPTGFNYVGPGTDVYKRISDGRHPTNKTDVSAMHHDMEHDEAGQLYRSGKINKNGLNKMIRNSDTRFINDVSSNGESGFVAKIAPWMIRAKRFGQDLGLLNPESFTF